MTRELGPREATGSDARLRTALEAFPVIGILRGCPPEHVVPIVAGAARGGLTVVEVTLDSPEPLRGIEAIASSLPNLVVGAGTVHGPEAVRTAAQAGASFVVSPHTDEATMTACRRASLPALPGAATPSEIVRAIDLGAFAVKVFPAAQLGGPDFLRAVMAPLRKPRLVPTGGVDTTNALDFLRAGALAVGLGSAVFSVEALRYGNGYVIERTVRELQEALG
jgi:2-dehydro-3-deoxyphosphogluconate aldolase/(4S)-4-hydroxy-2-oxoglutarate aldolase